MDELLLKIYYYKDLINLLIPILGLIITILVYLLNRQKKTEVVLQTYRELHEIFWTDDSIRQIRAWLACDDAYNNVKEIFEKRNALHAYKKNIKTENEDKDKAPPELTIEDYKEIETFDRFLNFLQRVYALSSNFIFRKKIWESLFFRYWLEQISEKEALKTYLDNFYETLHDELLKIIKNPRNKKQITRSPI